MSNPTKTHPAPRDECQSRGEVQASGYAVEFLGHDRGERSKSDPRRQGQIVSGPTNGTVISLNPQIEREEMPIPVSADDPQVSVTVQGWAKECQSHQEYGNLMWSTQTPTRLLHISPPSSVQLAETKDKSNLDYTCLSFCWRKSCQDGQAPSRTSSTAANDLLPPWISLIQLEMLSNLITKNVGVN